MIHGGVFKVGATGSNDPMILWDNTPRTSFYIDPDAIGQTESDNIYFYETGGAGYFLANPGSWAPREPTIDVSGGNFPFGRYLLKYSIVSESGNPNGVVTVYDPYGSVAEDTWGVCWRTNIVADTTTGSDYYKVVLDITLATNAAADPNDPGPFTPVPGSESTKRWTMIVGADQDGNDYQIQDRFSDTTGTPLTSHTPEHGPGWTVDSGDMEINVGTVRAVQVDGSTNMDNRAIMDGGEADTAVYASVDFNLDDNNGAGIVFRRSDANNYWLLKVDTPVSNPTLKLIAVVAGVESPVASAPIDIWTGFGGNTTYMRVWLSGSNIRGQFWTYLGAPLDPAAGLPRSEEQGLTTVEATNAFNSTATSHGFYLGNEACTITQLEVFSDEIGIIWP